MHEPHGYVCRVLRALDTLPLTGARRRMGRAAVGLSSFPETEIMAETQVIKAEQRPARGKGGARSVRRDGRVPGVIYGGDIESQDTISVDL
ncbi:MAG: hypothetical protein AB7F78_11720, partial [Hyphomicrobiaceae bacterium]